MASLAVKSVTIDYPSVLGRGNTGNKKSSNFSRGPYTARNRDLGSAFRLLSRVVHSYAGPALPTVGRTRGLVA